MNRGNMLNRIEAGDNPIDVSIQKWVDLKKRWNSDNARSSMTCALCYVYGDSPMCVGCPLEKIDDKCHGIESSWGRACNEHNPDIMLEALYKAKKHVEKSKTKVFKNGTRVRESL